MERLKPLSDAWLFWDAERLDNYPHSENDPPARRETGAGPGEVSMRKLLPRRPFGNHLICAAGVVAVMFVVGLAALLGSFLSAYTMLSETRSRAGARVIGDASPSEGVLAVYESAAKAVESKGKTVSLSSQCPQTRPRNSSASRAG